MEPIDPEFDDPALRAAISRAMNSAAPADLRGRVVAALDREDRLIHRWRRPAFKMAIAAMLLIGFGVAYMIFWRTTDRPIPRFLAAAMVAVHNQYAGAIITPDIHDSDLPTIRSKLAVQVGHPVLAAMLGDGWKYQGADIAKISGIPAAHLFFTRGDESISIFSIAAGAFYDTTVPNGTGYAQIENNQPISGFFCDGAVHCLVGSSKTGVMSLRTLTRIRQQIRVVMDETRP